MTSQQGHFSKAPKAKEKGLAVVNVSNASVKATLVVKGRT